MDANIEAILNELSNGPQTPEKALKYPKGSYEYSNAREFECPEHLQKYIEDKSFKLFTLEELDAIEEHDREEKIGYKLRTEWMDKMPTPVNPDLVDFEQKEPEYTNPNDLLPAHFAISEKYKFGMDEYLFRIPFSKNLPKAIYDGILGLEIIRKVVDKKNTKMDFMTLPKKIKILSSEIIDDFDLNSIIQKAKKHGFEIKENLSFKDVPYTGPQDYDIFELSDAFDGNLPNSVTRDEVSEYFGIVEAVKKYKEAKISGKISNEGGLFFNDMREVAETEDPAEIRNLQWITEINIEKYEFRCRVIKKEMQSMGEFKQTPEYEIEKKKEMIEEQIERERRLKEDTAKTDAENLIKMEDDFINDCLSFEEELKELRENFKQKQLYYKENGVQVAAVKKVLKRIKNELKKNPDEEVKENEIYLRLIKKDSITQRFRQLLAA